MIVARNRKTRHIDTWTQFTGHFVGANPVRRDGRVVPPGEAERSQLRLRLHPPPDQRGDQGRGTGIQSLLLTDVSCVLLKVKLLYESVSSPLS